MSKAQISAALDRPESTSKKSQCKLHLQVVDSDENCYCRLYRSEIRDGWGVVVGCHNRGELESDPKRMEGYDEPAMILKWIERLDGRMGGLERSVEGIPGHMKHKWCENHRIGKSRCKKRGGEIENDGEESSLGLTGDKPWRNNVYWAGKCRRQSDSQLRGVDEELHSS